MTPEQELAKNELDTFAALASVANSAGGQILHASLAKDILSAIDNFTANSGVMSETAMRALGAKLGVWLTMYRALHNAPQNAYDAQKELDAMLNP